MQHFQEKSFMSFLTWTWRKQALAAAAAAAAASARRHSLLRTYVPSGQQQEEFHKEFQKFVIISELPPILVQTSICEKRTYKTFQK